MEKACAMIAGVVWLLLAAAQASSPVSGQTVTGGPANGCGSNEVWLQMTMLTNNAAVFCVQTPPSDTNYCFNILLATNLGPGSTWTWAGRCDGVQAITNATVTNLPPTAFFLAETPIRPGFDQTNLPANDDGSTDLVPLPFTINFLSNSESALYINNNGNVTFGQPIYYYTPETLSSVGLPIIAPFWADVDTRNINSDILTYGTNIVAGRSAFGVDWINVGYYNEEADKLLSCQLVIIDRSDIAPGDFDLEFNYSKVQWEAGDASDGVDGIWMGPNGGPARAGFSDGNPDGNTYELPGSGIEGAFLDTNLVTGLIYNNMNSKVIGRYLFRFRDGGPPNIPAIPSADTSFLP